MIIKKMKTNSGTGDGSYSYQCPESERAKLLFSLVTARAILDSDNDAMVANDIALMLRLLG